MKKKMIPAVVAALASAAFMAPQASAIVLDISSAGDSGITFGGDNTFGFLSDSSGYVFEVNDVDGGVGDGAGLFGAISGSWTIDPWAGNTTSISGDAGSFTIWDADGTAFTADIDFENIGTVLSGGVINGSSNLTNFMYAGANSDLGLLYAAGSATLALSFEMARGPSNLSIDYLANTGGSSTFSGDIETPETGMPVPDGGTTAAMLGMGLLVVAGVARRKQAA